MSADLITFVTARLDEDERLALAATRDVWTVESWTNDNDVEFLVVADHDQGPPAFALKSERDAAHIARHDPARVLREVALKRRLLMLRTNAAGAVAGAWEGTPGRNRIVDQAYLEAITDVLAEVATAWSDHPDYRQEWTP